MRRDEAYVLDILKAAKTALKFKESTDKASFLNDELLQSGIIHQLFIIGEAVKKLSKEFKDSNPLVPWRLIAGMCDRLVHGYFDVDINEVWKTVDIDIPELIRLLEQ